MARPIDEKIVRMTLDNARFKQNVKDTLKSFDAINDGINSQKGMDLSRIADGISTIERRFSALGVVAATVISKITTKAMDMGKGLYHAMVDPLIEGGKKRALNIEQAKFQFEGLGMDVEKTMASANEAVLGTAFGLDEAAVVAAQFGASGMRAGKDMTDALRGISGVAAMTGSSYSDVGNIFTKVAGQGRLMGDDLLRLSARGVNAAATLGDAMGKTEAEIREMVTKGEISFEDFAVAMNDAFGEHATKANETYTGSLSNLKAALSRIGAAIFTPRFENLRDIFNTTTPVIDELNDALQPLIEAFNDLSRVATEKLISAIEKIDFKKFDELGGMTNLLESFLNVVDFGKTMLNALGEGFRRVFPGSFMTGLVNATEGLKNLTSNLKLSDSAASKITTIFQGVFSVFDTVYVIARELAKAIFGIIPSGTGGTVLDFLVLMSDMAIAMNESVREGNFLTEAIKGVGNVLGWFGSILKAPIDGIIRLSTSIKNNLGTALDWIKDKLAPVGEWLKEAFSGYGMDEALGGGFLVGVIMLIRKLSGFFDDAKENLNNITGTISNVFSELGGALKSFQDQVKYNNLMKIAVAIGLLAVSLKLLEGMSISDIAKGIGALTGSMAILAGGMMAIEKLNFTGGIRASVTILSLATTITIMAGALRMISGLDLKELGVGLLGLAGIMTVLAGGIAAISKLGGKIQTSSLQMLTLASSIVILASAVETMSQIKASSLAKSVLALGVIFAEIAIFLKVVDGSKIGPGTALGLIGVSAAVKIIVSAITDIASIDVGGLTKGLVTIGLILAEITLFSKLAGGPQILAAGVGIMMISAALSALMIPVTTMGKMSWEALAKGLGGMAVALTAVGVAGAAASGSILGAAGILAMALAMNALMPPILIFSAMSWSGMIKGFVGLGGGMAVLAGAALLLSPAIVPMLGFSAALLAMGVAVTAVGAGIALFGVGMTTLATLTATSVSAIISALGMLIRGFGTLITDVVDFVVELSIALIGGITKIIPEVVEAIAVLIVSLLETLAEHTPRFVTAGYDIIIGLLEGIQEKAPELQMTAAETMVALIVGMADAISENRTPMIEAIIRLMGEVILVVVEAGVKMIDALFGWIPGVSEATAAIGDTAEEYIREHFGAKEVGVEKGYQFAEGIEETATAAGAAGELIATSGEKGVTSINLSHPGEQFGMSWVTSFEGTSGPAEGAGKNVAKSGKSGASSVDLTNTGSDFGLQFTTGLGSMSGKSRTTGKSVAESGKTGAGSVSLTNTGKVSGGEFVTGVKSNNSASRTSGKNLAQSGRSGASGVSLTNVGKNFGLGFGRGINRAASFVITQATSLASRAKNAVSGWLKERSPSRVMMESGDNFAMGFANGIANRIRTVSSRAKEMAVNATNSLRDNLQSISPEDNEIKIKLILDDDDIDWDDLDPEPVPIRPDPNYTTDMVSESYNRIRQNDNNDAREGDDNSVDTSYYNYEINVTAGGSMQRSEVKKLAKQIQSEIKNLNDKDRMSRGEGVVF